jgi:hypothetical protein
MRPRKSGGAASKPTQLVRLQETHSEAGYPIDLATVTTPRGSLRWMWKCGCCECRALSFPRGFHGPFETERAAKQASDQLSIEFHDGANH